MSMGGISRYDRAEMIRLHRGEIPIALLAIEHTPAAYVADFVAYAVAVAALALWALGMGHGIDRRWLIVLAALGLVAWTLVEYLLHRFVLHGLAPFKRWHEEHHRRPAALIGAPTLVSGCLIATLIFLPAALLGGVQQASALTLGLTAGYLIYAFTHHATHHWRARTPWAKRRKVAHALHHRQGTAGGGYGVTTGFWDAAFGTTARGSTPA